MAQSKKSFIIYADLIGTIEALDDSEAGVLFKHMLRYVNDLNPEPPDKITKILFEPIKAQMKRDLEKWRETKSGRSAAGKLGGIKSGEVRSKTKQNEANEAVNVNANVTVNVNDTVRESNTPADPKENSPKNPKEEEKEKSSAKKENDLQHSNLFRQPKIPSASEVKMHFLGSGGTVEMAESFYNKNESTGWFIRGSPITNFRNLVPSYISNWLKNEKNGINTGSNGKGTETNPGRTIADDRP